jgi:hypothetical protein
MRIRAALVATSAAAGVGLSACTPAPKPVVPAVSEKVYVVTPNAIKVSAGILRGEVTEMKITERIEEGTGRIAAPARLTGKLVLVNQSTDQSVRLIGGRFLYIGMNGKPIVMEGDRAVPTLKVASAFGSQERMDPGQQAAQPLDAEFPVEGLKDKALREIRLEVSYIPSQFRESALNFPVSIGPGAQP